MLQQRTFALEDLCDSTAFGTGVARSSTTRASLFSESSGNSARLAQLLLQNLTVLLIALIVSTGKQRPLKVDWSLLSHYSIYYSYIALQLDTSHNAVWPLFTRSLLFEGFTSVLWQPVLELCLPLHRICAQWDYHTVNPFHAQPNLLVSWRTLTYNVILTTLTPPVNLHWVVLKITVSGEMTKQDVRV